MPIPAMDACQGLTPRAHRLLARVVAAEDAAAGPLAFLVSGGCCGGTNPVLCHRENVIEGFDVAAGQKPGELGLAGGASPALGDDRSRHGRYDAAEQQGAVTGPHHPLAPFGGDQRPGVVGDPGHAVRRAHREGRRICRS